MSNTSFSRAKFSAKKLKRNARKSLVVALSLSIAIPLMSAPSAQAAPNPTNYYQLEGNGSDSAGGQNATLVGSGYAAGKYGNGYSAAGPSSGYLDMGPNVGLFGAGNFTIGFWFNSAGGSGQILNKRITNTEMITIAMAPSGAIGTELRSLSASTGADIFRAPATGGGYNNGAWHHFAMVRSGGTVTLYVDGQVSATDTGLGDLTFNNTNYNSAHFVFGASAQLYPGIGFVGGLDELKIYSVALSQADVQASSLSPTPPPPPVLIDQAPLSVFFQGAATSPTRQLFIQGGSGTGAVSFDFVGGTGHCSIVGNTLTFGIPGNCLITATKAADSTYKSATSPANDVPYFVPIVPVVLPAPLITNVQALSSTSIRVFFNSVPNATGYQVNVYSNVDGSPLPGNTARVTTSATGALSLDVTGLVQNVQDPSTYFITEYQFRVIALGDGVAFLNSNESGTWTGHTLVEPLQPLTVSSGSIPFNVQWILNTSGGSPFGTVTFVLGNGGSASGCAISGNLLSATSAGTCLVTAQKSADRNYTATTSPQVAITFLALPPTRYTVTFNNNVATSGVGFPTATYNDGDTVQIDSTNPGLLAAAGLTFFGWSGLMNGTPLFFGAPNLYGSGVATSFVIHGNVTLYAQFALNRYVIYDNNGGTGSRANDFIPYNWPPYKVTLPDGAGFTKAGFTFAGWTKVANDASTLVTAYGDSTLVSSPGMSNLPVGPPWDITVYALWVPNFQIPLSITTTSGIFDTPLQLRTSGGSSTAQVAFSVANGIGTTGCAVDANGVLTSTSAGTCLVTANKAGDSIFQAVSSLETVVTIRRAPQAPISVTFTDGTFGIPIALNVSGARVGAPVRLEVRDGSAGVGCTITNGSLLSLIAGPCLVTAVVEADQNYEEVRSVEVTVNIARARSTATVVARADDGFFGTPIPVIVTGVRLAARTVFVVRDGSAQGCAITDGALSSLSAGTCFVVAVDPQDDQYEESRSVEITVTIRRATPAPISVTFTDGTFGIPIALNVSGARVGAPVRLEVRDGSAVGCTITNGALSSLSAGWCFVVAVVDADQNYEEVRSVEVQVNVARANAAPLLVTANDGVFGTPIGLQVSGGIFGAATTFEVSDGTAGDCVVLNFSLSSRTGGTCRITAVQIEDLQFNGVRSQTITVTFAPADQPKPILTASDGPFGVPIALVATNVRFDAVVTFEVTDGSAQGCSVQNGFLSSLTAGTCSVQAVVNGDLSYNLSRSDAVTVTFVGGLQVPLVVTSITGTFKTALTLTTSGGSSPTPVTFVVVNGTANGCLVTAGVLTSTSAGTCLVTATNPGDANFAPISSDQTVVTLAPAQQVAIVVRERSVPFTNVLGLSITGGSGNGLVTYVLLAGGTAAGCSITGSALTATSTGTCLVQATKAANANYLVAISDPATETFVQAKQAALSLNLVEVGVGTPINLVPIGGSGTGAVSFALIGGNAPGCTLNGAVLTASGAGSCVVEATKAADTNYLEITSPRAAEKFSRNIQAPLIVQAQFASLGALVSPVVSGGSGTGALSFKVSSGTANGCSLNKNGYIVSNTVGTCFLVATKAGDGIYLAMKSDPGTITFGPRPQAALFVTSTQASFGTGLPLTTTGGSGSGAVTFAVVNGTATGCTVSGSTLRANGLGTCIVTATKAETSFYLVATSAPTIETFVKAPQAALSITSNSNGNIGQPILLRSSGGSGSGAVTYALTSGSPSWCLLVGSGNAVVASARALCTVVATKAEDAFYLSISATKSFTFR